MRCQQIQKRFKNFNLEDDGRWNEDPSTATKNQPSHISVVMISLGYDTDPTKKHDQHVFLKKAFSKDPKILVQNSVKARSTATIMGNLVTKRNPRIFARKNAKYTGHDTAKDNQQHEYELTTLNRNSPFGANADALWRAEVTKKATAAAA
jgi:hypothetical protein